MQELCVAMTEKRLESSPIYYYVSGSENSECILFVHAAFADHTQFNNQVNFFALRYKVITLDLLGHGKSRKAFKGDNIEKMSKYIFDIISEERVDKAHLVGVSLGAVIIQDFANKYPENVASLSCFGGYDINNFDLSIQKENGGAQMRMMMKAVFSIKWFAETNKKISAITPQAQQDFYEMNLRFPKKSFMFLAGINSMVNKFKPKIPRNYPLLIGCGERDISMELKACEMWHSGEPLSKKIVIPDAGHLVNMDAPEYFNDILDDFLTGRL